MEMQNSTSIARALINRYGLQAQAIAEEQADIMAQQDPGARYLWEQVPSVVCEFRRSAAAQERLRGTSSRR